MIRRKPYIARDNIPIVIIVIGATIIFYGVFFIYPVVLGFINSFYDWSPLRVGKEFIGFANYIRAFNDPHFSLSLRNTIIFTVGLVLVRTFVGLFAAVAINSVKRFRAFFRTSFFIPVVASMLAAALIWNWIFDPSVGIINTVLNAMGISTRNLLWLNSTKTSLLGVMIMTSWKELGFGVVLYLAGLSGIPQSAIESAQIDGANPWQIFWKMKWPLLKPTTVFVMLTGTIGYLQTYTQIYGMTEGGPAWSSSTLVYLIVFEGFGGRFNFGYASALTQILFVLIVIIALVQFWILRRGWKA
jgi:ABC-type sugar transport system permease subunit